MCRGNRHAVQNKWAKSVHLSQGYVNALQVESKNITVSNQQSSPSHTSETC